MLQSHPILSPAICQGIWFQRVTNVVSEWRILFKNNILSLGTRDCSNRWISWCQLWIVGAYIHGVTGWYHAGCDRSHASRRAVTLCHCYWWHHYMAVLRLLWGSITFPGPLFTKKTPSYQYRDSHYKPEPLFTKKTPSYQYRDSHYKPETVVRPS